MEHLCFKAGISMQKYANGGQKSGRRINIRLHICSSKVIASNTELRSAPYLLLIAKFLDACDATHAYVI
jgi:hypothetical protein